MVKLNVPALWTEKMGEVIAKQNELAAGVYATGQSIQEMREGYRKERAFWNEGGPSVASAVDSSVPTRHGEVKVRHYRPEGIAETAVLPVIVYIHGGGWILGDLDTHDRVTRTLCALTKAAVIAIDYTLSPEAKYPQALEECVDVVAYIHENAAALQIDGNDISFAGDSGGAHLSLATILKARDEGKGYNLRAMLLYYGAFGLRDSESMRLLGGPWDGLTEEDYRYYLSAYLNDLSQVETEKYVNLLSNDFAQGIPAAYVMGAALDPLRDDSRTLARILEAQGVPVQHEEIPGVIHGFIHHSRILPQTMEVLERSAQYWEQAKK
ncbi:MAG: alpha/beta hydrolase fold domain-containing protein [Arcanobacterium sp.]|nr:alpha/beta hydrolase fold domain-containing protein [Arcanobacterium sp.]